MITIKYHNIEAEVEITTPYRSAPACSNPDSPAFSDPGDGAEFDIESATKRVTDESGIKIDLPLSEKEIQELYDDNGFYEVVCEACDRLAHEKYEREYEPEDF